MKREVSEREKTMLCYLIGILVVVCAFMFVFRPLRTKNVELGKRQDVLESELETLRKIKENESQYKADIKQNQKECDKYYDQFPAMVTAQDQILYASDLENRFGSMQISLITLDEAEYVTGVDEDAICLYRSPVSMEYKIGYEDVKKFLNTLSEEKTRKSIDKITLTFDSASGGLIGTMDMNSYYLTGTGKTYTPPNLDDVLTGTTNLFNVNGLPVEQSTEE